MKTAMKKIFSLMLVAVLLVSAVPFAASAAEATVTLCLITVSGGEVIDTAEITVNTEDVLGSVTAEANSRWGAEYTFVAGSTEIKEGNRVFARMTPKQVEPTPLSCPTCGETYTGTEHTCPILTCPTCKGTYTKGTEHSVCDTTTCTVCGHVYTANTSHECAKKTCEKCNVTYVEALGHFCTIPAEPVTYTVNFVADPADRTKIFWSVEVMDGKTVYYPGINPDSAWDCLTEIGDVGNLSFMGWSTNKDAKAGDYSTSAVVRQTITGGDRTYYAIYKEVAVDPPTSSRPGNITNKDNTNKVYLHIYLNKNAGTIAKTIDITEYDLLKDDKTTAGEIWTYLTKTYYAPKDASKTIEIDGLYVNTGVQGTFPQNYYTDKKVAELDNINSLLDNGYVHINVMLNNVATNTSSSSAKADSSNPKTGDMIMAPVMVLGLSASALAVLFFLNKKRAY